MALDSLSQFKVDRSVEIFTELKRAERRVNRKRRFLEEATASLSSQELAEHMRITEEINQKFDTED